MTSRKRICLTQKRRRQDEKLPSQPMHNDDNAATTTSTDGFSSLSSDMTSDKSTLESHPSRKKPICENVALSTDDAVADSSGEWLLCRHDTAASSKSTSPTLLEAASQSQSSSSQMVLRSHLGNPADMVDSLVDHMENWSLTRVKVVTPEKGSDSATKQKRRQAQKEMKKALLSAPANFSNMG